MSEQLKIRLLGQVEISEGERSVLSHLSNKSVAMIAFLICHGTKRVSREKLSSLLWGDSYETASYNLRYNLWNIKKVLPKDEEGRHLILSNKEYCWVNPEYRLDCDVLHLHELEEIDGEFMEQCYLKDCDEFNEWVLMERTRYQRQILKLLKEREEQYRVSGDLSTVADSLQSQLRFNPYDEEIHFQLMELYLSLGQRHRAVEQYVACEDLLRREMNMVPKKKMRELYSRILKDRNEEDARPQGGRMMETENTGEGKESGDPRLISLEQGLAVLNRSCVITVEMRETGTGDDDTVLWLKKLEEKGLVTVIK